MFINPGVTIDKAKVVGKNSMWGNVQEMWKEI